MTIRKNFRRAPTSAASYSVAQRSLVIGAVLAGLSGCGMISSVVGDNKVDYKSAKQARPLDVPPDLTQLQKDNRYSLPGTKDGIATASGYNAQRAGAAGETVADAGQTPVGLAPAGSGIKVERAGNQRWLVVKQTPEALWPQLQSFWQDNGFPLVMDLPEAGLMETDWVENRGKVPQDFLHRQLSKVFDSFGSSGEQDKFRTRLERLPDGSTEIYISQRGMSEQYQGAAKENVVWAPSGNDSTVEAEYLARLMIRLGGAADQAQAKTAVDTAIVQPLHAKLVGEGATRYVEVDEGFDRAWRRVGLALDRVGFTVEDRDRTQGLYFVRYADPDAVKKEGFFKKLFSWGSDSEKDKEAQRYRITVKAAAAGGTSNVAVLTNDGKQDPTPTSEKILGLLNEQLK